MNLSDWHEFGGMAIDLATGETVELSWEESKNLVVDLELNTIYDGAKYTKDEMRSWLNENNNA